MKKLIKTDGTITDIEEKVTLEVAQRLVGGYIEFAPLNFSHKNTQLIVNEEGLLQSLPHNPKASAYMHPLAHRMGMGLVGDVVLLTDDDRMD